MKKTISLPILFQDHMMLQRGKTLYIDGHAAGMDTIRLTLGSCEVQADVRGGAFSLEIPPQGASLAMEMNFYADDDAEPLLTLTDVSAGDIWIAAGQSNMEFYMRYDADWQYTKQQKHSRRIRMFNMPQICFEGQTRENVTGQGYWFEETDEGWPFFSAPGWYFAANIEADLDVPVGIIGCNWGGTPACAWMAEKYLAEEPLNVWNRDYERDYAAASAGKTPEEFRALCDRAWAWEDSYDHQILWRAMMEGMSTAEQQKWQAHHKDDPAIPMGPYNMYRPTGLYHTMIEQLAPFCVKGVLWYQGESDAVHPDIYHTVMEKLIECWREVWDDPFMPFLFVQLAPFGHWLDCTNDGYAEVRARQELVSRTVPGTWMASIMDLGSYEDIHPKQKKEIGRRLALLAEKYVYNMDVEADAPTLSAVKLLGCDPEVSALTGMAQLLLRFDRSGEGLNVSPEFSQEVSIVDADGPVDIIDLQVRGDLIILSLGADGSSIRFPLTVRCGCDDYSTIHLHNSNGLCAKPFRFSLSGEE